MGKVLPVLGGIVAQRGRETSFSGNFVSAAAGPTGHPDFQKVGHIFNHGLGSHESSVLQAVSKQQGREAGKRLAY